MMLTSPNKKRSTKPSISPFSSRNVLRYRCLLGAVLICVLVFIFELSDYFGENLLANVKADTYGECSGLKTSHGFTKYIGHRWTRLSRCANDFFRTITFERFTSNPAASVSREGLPRHAGFDAESEGLDPLVGLANNAEGFIPPAGLADAGVGDSPFSGVYVAHYHKHHRRRKHLAKELDKYPALSELAVWTPQMARELIDQSVFECFQKDNSRMGRPFADGEFVVTLNHFVFYYDIVAHQRPISLIMEDDVSLAEDFMSSISEILAEAPEDFDLIFLGGNADFHAPEENSVGERLRAYDVARYAFNYVVSLKGAKRMLESLPISWPVDYQMSHMSDLCIYFAEPPISWEGSFRQRSEMK